MHDGRVAHVSHAIDEDGGCQLTLLFSALFVTPSAGELEGEYRPARLRLDGARWADGTDPAVLVGELADGWWERGSAGPSHDFAALPTDSDGRIRVALQRADDGAIIELTAARATLELNEPLRSLP